MKIFESMHKTFQLNGKNIIWYISQNNFILNLTSAICTIPKQDYNLKMYSCIETNLTEIETVPFICIFKANGIRIPSEQKPQHLFNRLTLWVDQDSLASIIVLFEFCEDPKTTPYLIYAKQLMYDCLLLKNFVKSMGLQ